MNAYAPPLHKKSRRRKVTVTWLEHWGRNGAERETVATQCKRCFSPSKSWEQLSKRTEPELEPADPEQPAATASSEASIPAHCIMRGRTNTTISGGLDSRRRREWRVSRWQSWQSSDKTRERKRKGQENQGKNNKKKNSSLKFREALEGRGFKRNWAPL